MVASFTEVMERATPNGIDSAIRRLRESRRTALVAYGSAGNLQAAAVSALAGVARRRLDPSDAFRQRIKLSSEPFSYEETWPSLEALCRSMTEEALWDLIDSESMRGVLGPEVLGHVIAANTPLLAWTSAARALLIGSASLLKLPSESHQRWSRALFESLRETAAELADLIAALTWPSSEADCTRALCTGTDGMVAYGSDETMRAIKALMPPERKLLEYGHRVSCAIVVQGADDDFAAAGLAWDTWVYDQRGCLSPQCIFVEGTFEDAARFGEQLARALARLPLKTRTLADAAVVQEQRLLSRMKHGIILHEGEALSWTVCVGPVTEFFANDAPMFVHVVPGRFQGMIQALSLWADHLQGICLCARTTAQRNSWIQNLRRLGAIEMIEPGEMQRPLFSWRENGRDVLRSLLL